MPDGAPRILDGTALLALLKSEVGDATGCTEIAAAALAAARAVEILGRAPRSLRLEVGASVFRNGANAGVPGIGRHGLAAAAALGAAIAAAAAGLTLLDAATSEHRADAERRLDAGLATVSCLHGAPPLFLCAIARDGADVAEATISGRHDAFTDLRRNGEALSAASAGDAADPLDPLRDIGLRRILRLARNLPAEALGFLIDAAETNAAAARAARDRHGPLAAALSRAAAARPSPRAAAQSLAGAASEGRMAGMTAPVAAICGSGNHGIANFLGVLGVAEDLGANRETLARALAIASAVTLAVKAHTGRLSATCGCAVAPATGVAAPTAFLAGGDDTAQEHAMQSVIGAFAGLICDGAKTSCAYKVAAVVGAAVDLGLLAAEGAYVPDGEGLVGPDIDATLVNLARLDRQGLRGAEAVVLEMIGA